jgi:membrane protease YdiL (CAAX protease family)
VNLVGTTASYDLAGWSDDARRDLDALLRWREITATWRDHRLTVDRGVRAEVDDLVAYLNGAAAPGATRAHPAGSPGAIGPAPSWYPNPEDASTWRWWDGNRWTAFTTTAPAPTRPWLPRRGERDASALTGGGVIALVGFVVAQAGSVGAVLLAIELGATRRSVLTLSVGAVAFWSGLLLACVVAVRRHGSGSLRDLGLVGLRRADLGSGLVGSVVARVAGAAAAAALILVLPDESYGESTSLLDQGRPSVAAALVVGLIVVVGAPFVEELFFRGLVQGVLVRRVGAASGLVVQAVAFGAVHYQIGMAVADVAITVSVISVAGYTLGVLRWHSQRLGPGMVAHAAFNLVAVVVTFLVL